MFDFRPHRFRRQGKFAINGILVLLSLTLCLSWGMTTLAEMGTVDWVSPKYQLGQQLYLENCSSCHIPIPPQVLPTQTWQQVLQDTQHYGVQLPPLVDPPRLIIWNYLQRYSRPLLQYEEVVPYRVNRSRYFKVLHPEVAFPQPVTLEGCVSCHPGANQNNFRKLTPQWQSIESSLR